MTIVEALAYAATAAWATVVLATAVRETRRTERALEVLEREGKR